MTAASRGALLAMLPSLALEPVPRRIRVNAVSPGTTETPIPTRLGMSREAAAAYLAGVGDQVPLGRVGSPAHIAGTVAFLASDTAAHITGQEIVVAGGAGLSP